MYNSRIKSLISLTGRNPHCYSTHSFRRGGASFAFQCQVPGETIKLLGDWSSDAYLQYLHLPMQVRASAAFTI